MYAILTLRLHFPPEYVLDKMEMYEVKALMKYEYYAYKDGWEQARLVAYTTALVNTKKHLNMTDLVKFHWEKIVPTDTSLSNKEKERLMQKARQYENRFKK